MAWGENQARMQPIRTLLVPLVQDLDLQLPRVSKEKKNIKCTAFAFGSLGGLFLG